MVLRSVLKRGLSEGCQSFQASSTCYRDTGLRGLYFMFQGNVQATGTPFRFCGFPGMGQLLNGNHGSRCTVVSQRLITTTTSVKADEHEAKNTRTSLEVLRLKEKEIELLNMALKNKESALKHKESALKDKESALNDKESALNDKESALEDTESTIICMEALLKHKESGITHMVSALKDKDSLIKSMRFALSYSQDQLENCKRVLEGRSVISDQSDTDSGGEDSEESGDEALDAKRRVKADENETKNTSLEMARLKDTVEIRDKEIELLRMALKDKERTLDGFIRVLQVRSLQGDQSDTRWRRR